MIFNFSPSLTVVPNWPNNSQSKKSDSKYKQISLRPLIKDWSFRIPQEKKDVKFNLQARFLSSW